MLKNAHDVNDIVLFRLHFVIHTAQQINTGSYLAVEALERCGIC